MNAQDDKNIKTIQKSIALMKNFVNFTDVQQKLQDIEIKILNPTFWDNSESATKIIKEKEKLTTLCAPILYLETQLNDTQELLDILAIEKDEEMELQICSDLSDLATQSISAQIESVLSNEHDSLNCFVEINAGAGGTEAQDWAEMLARMYARWAEKKTYKIEITDKNNGEEAGVKSITMLIKGSKAFGWLKKETGVHRLVRISPFDSNSRRHTSFASVFITPELNQEIHIDVVASDLRIDTFRASGAGGQHVNKTESAIRITHIPTGTVTQCQTDRSQHRNKDTAMNMLKSKLYALKLNEQKAENDANATEKTDIAWGNQIRSYVLQPYQMVKDTRTGVEKGNAAAVLDGEINEFLEAAVSELR